MLRPGYEKLSLSDLLSGGLFILITPIGYLLLVIRRNNWSLIKTSLVEYISIIGVIVFWVSMVFYKDANTLSWIGANFGVLVSLVPIMPGSKPVIENDFLTRFLYSIAFTLGGFFSSIGITQHLSSSQIINYCSNEFDIIAIVTFVYLLTTFLSLPKLSREPNILSGLVSTNVNANANVDFTGRILLFIPVFLILPYIVKILPNYLEYIRCLLFVR